MAVTHKAVKRHFGTQWITWATYTDTECGRWPSIRHSWRWGRVTCKRCLARKHKRGRK